MWMSLVRKQRQQQEDVDGSFNRSQSVEDGGVAGGGAPTTPKQKIVIM